ncbi:MAG: hypothetical protein Tsb0014_30500 [Pleurocapsa sp.]
MCRSQRKIFMFNPVFDFSETSIHLYWQLVYRSVSSYIIPSNFPSTAIIAFAPDGKIVLIQRQDTQSWTLPGGEITWGESIKKNVRRTMTAETGLELVKIKHIAGLYFPTDNSQAHSFTEVVVADVRGDIKIKNSLEVAEVRLFNLDNLPALKQTVLNRKSKLQCQST